jgi:hypothetical protein
MGLATHLMVCDSQGVCLVFIKFKTVVGIAQNILSFDTA